MTSDAFFEQYDVRDLFGGLPVDIGYIDGLHLFEFALRDFINLERVSSSDSVILIDDTDPPTPVSASRERATNVWAGDVWKLVVCLRRHRPDLEVSTVQVAPTGVTIVRGLDPRSKQLSDSYDELCEEFVDLPYSTIEHDKQAALNSVAPIWSEVVRRLPDRPYRTGDLRLLRLRRALRRPTVANTRYRAGQILRHGPTRALVERVSGARHGRDRGVEPAGPEIE
jgi:hypothetical protein